MTSDLPTIADNLLSITVDYGGAPVRLYGPDETPDSVPEAMLPARILLYGAGRAAGAPFGFIAIGTMADVEWTLIDLLLIGPVSQGRGLLDVARATLQYMSDYAEGMRAFRQPGLPEPQPVEVIEHRLVKRWCPVCRAWQQPEMNWTERVVGQGRIGVRLGALIAYLHQSLRAPVRVIQAYLATIHQVRLSVGEISGLLQRLYQQVRPAIEALKHSVQQESVVHGDETGWRGAGQNGYIWCLATGGEQSIRYYEYDRSRAGAVVTRLLGEAFHGHLVSDFYGGYNVYSGPHQRCWVHLLRDLKHLQEHRGLRLRAAGR